RRTSCIVAQTDRLVARAESFAEVVREGHALIEISYLHPCRLGMMVTFDLITRAVNVVIKRPAPDRRARHQKHAHPKRHPDHGRRLSCLNIVFSVRGGNEDPGSLTVYATEVTVRLPSPQ